MYIDKTAFFKAVYSTYGREPVSYLQYLVFALEYLIALKNGTADISYIDDLKGTIPVVVNIEELKKKL